MMVDSMSGKIQLLKNKNQDKTIELTCPICESKIEFDISCNELSKAKSEFNIIKKAINHNNEHVVVVHIDSQGNVRRTYGYQCANLGTDKTISNNKYSLSTQKSLDIDPDNMLRTILDDMIKSSKKL